MQKFRYPNITAPDAEGQLRQMQDYLRGLSNQLNIALKATETQEAQHSSSITASQAPGGTNAPGAFESAAETFGNIKNLIIKSADIVNAYYEIINQKLQGQYVAESDFGTFKTETESNFEASSESILQNYEAIQSLENSFNGSELRKDNCYIRTGWLDENYTESGVEIGRTTSNADGTVTYSAFARFTDAELAFYDENLRKVAWFSKYRMHISNITVEGSIEIAGYSLEDSAYGLALIWSE